MRSNTGGPPGSSAVKSDGDITIILPCPCAELQKLGVEENAIIGVMEGIILGEGLVTIVDDEDEGISVLLGMEVSVILGAIVRVAVDAGGFIPHAIN